MSTRLKLADSLSLPLDAVTQKHAWLGVTGSGKTYGASKLAELFWHAGAQFVVLDPRGRVVWPAPREKRQDAERGQGRHLLRDRARLRRPLPSMSGIRLHAQP